MSGWNNPAAAGGKEIGDIVMSGKAALDAGNVLIPLATMPRPMNTAELAAYPLLAAALPDRWGATNIPSSHGQSALSQTIDALKIKATSDGQFFYYGNAHTLVRYSAATNSGTVIYTGASGADDIVNIDVSADGVTIAIISATNVDTSRVSVSNDSGASFTDVYTGTVSGNTDIDYLSALKVSADGDTVTWITMGSVSNDVTYQRIDGALASLTIDVVTDITDDVGGAATGIRRLRGAITNDGQGFFIIVSVNSTFLLETYHSSNAGTTITQRKPPAYNPLGGTHSNYDQYNCDIDEINSNILISTSIADGTTGVNYSISIDAGVTWQEIPNMVEHSNLEPSQTGDFTTPQDVRNPIKCHNGHMFMTSSRGQLFSYYIDTVSGISPVGMMFSQIATNTAQNSMWGIGISADGLTGGICGLLSSIELPYTNGTMTFGANIPSSGNPSNLKIVADAP